ncbi:Uncharacterized protein BM_BM13340 [Brugia malayi]|uniref:Neurotransmitter-gated ion-channel ligand-binding domain-containing protein n=1 Tax=Brugia malayi TaxID=6279 RepID=A0A4E9EVP4_BRUMA|nr:Uncharacterized protein BM_BM13340 [Brugia malayi]VIO87745.1 Uncharacterized protein BM_BM13340 [Brugia malayi]
MKGLFVLILFTIKMSQSDKRLVSNFANEMEKLNSLASIDSKEMIIEGSNNEYKDESMKIIITRPDTIHSTNLLINKPNIEISDRKKVIILNLMSNLNNLDDCTGICDSHYGSSYILPILRSINYDNNTVPTTFSDLPVDVSFALKIIHLANFDSKNMDYSIDFEMQMSWIDSRLMNNYTKWIRIWEKRILDQIWKPDPITLQPSCYMVFCQFPHDDQQCELMISSLSHIPSSVRFSWLSTNPINLMSTHPSPDFNLVSVHTHHCVVDGKLLPSSCLRVLFKLKRTGARFIIEKYIPSSLAMFFAWIAPFVPYNYEEVRIITPISVKHVHINYITPLDIWFRAMKIFTVLSLFESVVVLALIRATRAIEKRRLEAANEFEREIFRVKKRQVIRLYQRLDYFTQIFSPLLFTTFLMYYIMNVVHGEYNDCNANTINN